MTAGKVETLSVAASETVGAVRAWMDSYRTAWEELDRDALSHIFSLQSQISLSPFDRLVSYEQLPSLWDNLAQRQCENFLDFDILKIVEREAFVHWRCLTTHPVTRVRRLGLGVFALQFDGPTCTKQMEWCKWPSTIGGVPPIPLSKIRALTRHIDQRPGERITITNLATEHQISSRHVTRLFRVFSGLPIHQYVIRQRLIRARERLAWVDEPIIDIAYDLGFAHQAHFISAFKHSTAFTPAQYRARFHGAKHGPVHDWLPSFRKMLHSEALPRLESRLSLPRHYPALQDCSLRRRWTENLDLEVLADTPSNALVHWKFPMLEEPGRIPAGDGVFLLKFAPDGHCYGAENYCHWH